MVLAIIREVVCGSLGRLVTDGHVSFNFSFALGIRFGFKISLDYIISDYVAGCSFFQEQLLRAGDGFRTTRK